MKFYTTIRSAVVSYGKNLKVIWAYICDAFDFCKYAMYIQDLKGSHDFRIMLLTHSLEKGMCMVNPRPYGEAKARQLYNILTEYHGIKKYEYQLGCSILTAYVQFFIEHDFQLNEIHQKIKTFLEEEKDSIVFEAGKRFYAGPEPVDYEIEKVLLNRRSVRSYKKDIIQDTDLSYAIRFFSEAPSACNRQMCRIYRIMNGEMKELMNKVILGNNGFDKESVNYFIITYNISAFDYSGERSQGLFNAGLAAMQFVNGLHLRGIGSCFMEWSNKRKEDKIVRKRLKLQESERIAVVIGAGYYLPQSTIAASCRRPLKEIYQEL